MATLPDDGPPQEWDAEWYLHRYPDLAGAHAEGRLGDPLLHYLMHGKSEGRFPSAAAEIKATKASADVPSSVDHVMLGGCLVPFGWPVGGEAGKTFQVKLVSGFFSRYVRGPVVLDIGFKGGTASPVPIFPHAIGVDLDYPGYDGRRLPFDDGSVDTVFASHVLEHVDDAKSALRDWFRVIRTGGSIICIVPHQFLYERKTALPSRWSGEHLRFYSPAALLRLVENALTPNSYRVRHLADNDLCYNYSDRPEQHPSGCYEIELVIEKIPPPLWSLEA
jgi:SAM-dependent methyltransferase